MRQNDETGVNFPHGLSVIVANFLFKLFNGLRYFFEKVFRMRFVWACRRFLDLCGKKIIEYSVF